MTPNIVIKIAEFHFVQYALNIRQPSIKPVPLPVLDRLWPSDVPLEVPRDRFLRKDRIACVSVVNVVVSPRSDRVRGYPRSETGLRSQKEGEGARGGEREREDS